MADDRTPDEVARTIGFWVATDRFLSGWGHAPGRSIVACPVTGSNRTSGLRKRKPRRSTGYWLAGARHGQPAERHARKGSHDDTKSASTISRGF